MKLQQVVIIAALGLSVCCSSLVPTAQATGVDVQPLGSAPSAARIERLAIADGTPLQEAVGIVQNHMPTNQQPINVVYGAGAGSQIVPALSLRNVAGPDALMLVAAAANVHIEPIRGLVDEAIIGFRLSQRPKPVPQQTQKTQPASPYAAAGAPKASAYGAHSSPPPYPPAHVDIYGPAQGNPFGSGGLAAGSSGGSKPGGVPGTGGGIGTGGSGAGYGGGGYAGDGGGVPSAVSKPSRETTRIYPLAEIGTFVEFSDFEGTVSALLKTAEISAKDARLAFHEKTGVLAVRGSDEVQRLVQDLLQAVAKNHRQTQETDAARKLAQMQIEIEALQGERERLVRRVQETEAVAANYERELRRLKEQVPDKK